LLFDIPLAPLQGTRFQPTGFPDLGAATYQAGDHDALLVESAQSMANRLEATIWSAAEDQLVTHARGLSYVRVHDQKGAFLTASVLEAHRLNSPYIEKAKGDFAKKLPEALGVDKKRPLDRKKFTEGLLRFDVNTLLHGVFLESIDGRLRIPRALSAFVEATDVTVAASGGVKNDRVQAETGDRGGAAEGFGNVPFPREEYTARSITAAVSLDVEQIRAYGLSPEATSLLLTLALYKVRALFDGGLRLRTACDFGVVAGYDWKARPPAAFKLPPLHELEKSLAAAVKDCAKHFATKDGITTVTFEI
jgi:CRISPR-associated protein Csb1